MSVRFSPAVSGGGGIPAGPAGALMFYDPTGTTIAADPALVARNPGNYGRPEIWDHRVGSGGRGPVYRLGAWGIDGDPSNTPSEGFVTYGPNAQGNGPSSNDGGLGFYTPNSWGCLQIINGVFGNNPFYSCGFEDGGPAAPFGFPGFSLRDDQARLTFLVDRTTGATKIGIAQLDLAAAPIVIPYAHTGAQDEPILGAGAPTKGIILAIAVAIVGAPPAGSAQAFAGLLGAGARLSVQQAGWFPGEFSLAGLPTTIASGGPAYFNTANPAMWAGVQLRTLFCPLP